MRITIIFNAPGKTFRGVVNLKPGELEELLFDLNSGDGEISVSTDTIKGIFPSKEDLIAAKKKVMRY